MANVIGGHGRRLHLNAGAARARGGITLIEMLIATAITLVMMAAVVTVFANISGSISRRRAGIELGNQLRQVRGVLQADLQNATCPPTPWQRPESNQGYFEVIEGPQSDANPTIWLGTGIDGRVIDLSTSTLPSSAIPNPANPDEMAPAGVVSNAAPAGSATDGLGLGDWDDILMFTIRSEPMNGRAPGAGGASQIIQSTEAEVVWFAVENPVETNRSFYFGEPGFRTVYRRTLLVAPWLNMQINVNGMITGPGVLRAFPSIGRSQVDQALAELVAFQERFDLSVRLEWDPQLSAGGCWTIHANSLADLVKRENRFEHHAYNPAVSDRRFPFAAASVGMGVNVTDVEFTPAPSYNSGGRSDADADAVLVNGGVAAFRLRDSGDEYLTRPFVYVNATNAGAPVVARAILNESGQVVHVTTGFVPLGGDRRGQDIMLTEVLAFDVRVFDPGAPRYAYNPDGAAAPPLAMVSPGDPAWANAYARDFSEGPSSLIGDIIAGGQNQPWGFAGAGAYVDLGYGVAIGAPFVGYTGSVQAPVPSFYEPRFLPNTAGIALAPRFAVYDTWSMHYENNGLDEDADGLIDEAVNGIDDLGFYQDVPNGPKVPDRRFGPDDPGERETTPPYDATLRGVQVTIRAYERDSRQLNEVSVNASLSPH